MAENKETEVVETTEQPTPAPDERSINSQAKDLSWVKELRAENAAFKREADERATAEKQAAIDKAKEKDDFAEVLRLQQDESAKKIGSLERENVKLNVMAAIAAKGAMVTDGLVNVAVAEYQAGDFDSFETFADSLSSNENYAGFFGADTKRVIPNPPGKAPITPGTPRLEDVKAWENSDDPEKQLAAADFNESYFKAHGRFP
ncbi:MAG: hypothetical protein GY847_28920 [Proteobacteria bacterium]|nr:hypothetical protein [Pseudomonadota bacterium]